MPSRTSRTVPTSSASTSCRSAASISRSRMSLISPGRSVVSVAMVNQGDRGSGCAHAARAGTGADGPGQKIPVQIVKIITSRGSLVGAGHDRTARHRAVWSHTPLPLPHPSSLVGAGRDQPMDRPVAPPPPRHARRDGGRRSNYLEPLLISPKHQGPAPPRDWPSLMPHQTFYALRSVHPWKLGLFCSSSDTGKSTLLPYDSPIAVGLTDGNTLA